MCGCEVVQNLEFCNLLFIACAAGKSPPTHTCCWGRGTHATSTLPSGHRVNNNNQHQQAAQHQASQDCFLSFKHSTLHQQGPQRAGRAWTLPCPVPWAGQTDPHHPSHRSFLLPVTLIHPLFLLRQHGMELTAVNVSHHCVTTGSQKVGSTCICTHACGRRAHEARTDRVQGSTGRTKMCLIVAHYEIPLGVEGTQAVCSRMLPEALLSGASNQGVIAWRPNPGVLCSA